MPVRLIHLLWIDSGAALTAGIVVIGLSGWLSAIYELPRPLLVMMGVANLAYGTYSGLLARQTRRRYGSLVLLVVANAAWAAACGLAAASLADTLSVFGLAHFVGEGTFVGTLAALEWRARERLISAS